ncbi:DUF4035 domain-containing protein [Burkholderia pseudomallei]|uniref:phage tail assembly protein T n=2 Tax=Burkholderia pseudomallei TaxID=28450 RepID=UPI001A0FB934|nr:DUF4035 domain-containing protein [Burkholderia pseudomallei]MBF3659704.1 DUF4035 domain-containing protein [Burkholderia pseudomallei]MBF3700090.1 DUF4035 domain-containing protein [Burkholderia pseudomallei]MBF3727123.1 DUF4035 domain-containing protein [Burkholderia pseudomallei]MBF3750404.1 DUF4035 domain-containing protein [Burkholderia pseudomallei]MBO2978675.1 DUF4035 domain-containing protein [Burkholderia pseudomallei]
MSLALRLGKTLAELREQMSSAELSLWIGYDAESPVADDRADLHAAMIAAAAFQSQGAKVKVSDMMPRWSGEPATAEGEEGGGDPFQAALMRMAK